MAQEADRTAAIFEVAEIAAGPFFVCPVCKFTHIERDGMSRHISEEHDTGEILRTLGYNEDEELDVSRQDKSTFSILHQGDVLDGRAADKSRRWVAVILDEEEIEQAITDIDEEGEGKIDRAGIDYERVAHKYTDFLLSASDWFECLKDILRDMAVLYVPKPEGGA